MSDPAPAKTESEPRLFRFAIDVSSAQIVKFESLDVSGSQRELSEEEKARLLREVGARGLEEFLEQAFEAGIACVLGDQRTDSAKESPDEAQLRHMLLMPLIERSAAKRLMEKDLIRRAILATLLRESVQASSAQGGAASTDSAET